MRVVYLGTPEFAVPTLEALSGAGHEIAAVLTQPDRPKGRGHEVSMSPVKKAALALGLTVHQPERIRRPEVVQMMAAMKAEVVVVVGYGQIIPQSIIDLPPLGIINVHASLLPKYRGAAPIQWAIANGETVTGVTTMRINAGLDTGDMLLKARTEIGADETAVELGTRLAPIGAALLTETLRGLEAHTITPEPQNDAYATLAPILTKTDGDIDWTQPASVIHNRARGFQPWPGAHTTFRGSQLQIWRTRVAAEPAMGEPGKLRPEKRRLFAACGDGTAIEILELQLQGRNRTRADAFLNGQRVTANERLGESTT
jgi:methionyl-tRNA formyltransferase